MVFCHRGNDITGVSAAIPGEEDINAAAGILGCDVDVVIAYYKGLPEKAALWAPPGW